MTITFDLSPHELNASLLEKIRQLVAGSSHIRIAVAVGEEVDETTLLLQDTVLLQRVAAIESGSASLSPLTPEMLETP